MEVGDTPLSKENEGHSKIEISLATASSMFPGFRFLPTDEELISYYLKRKLEGTDECVGAISEVEIWRYEPWELPARSVVQSDNEWFFFTPRGRKYPNGSQSRRATESGYWKATGKNRNVKSGSKIIGTKRTLVFYTGRAPEGQRTHWIMHEYCSGEIQHQEDSMVVCRLRKNKGFHLNDTPRNVRNQSTGDNRNNACSELNTKESCSKPCSSSFNCHPVEQIDSGFDYDQINEIPQPGFSDHQKDHGNEDDCFADIMRDDIIKLDDPSLNTPLDALSMSNKLGPDIQPSQTSQGLTPHMFPFQGTANRRLILRREKMAPFGKAHGEISRSHKKQTSRRVISMLSSPRLKTLSIYALVVSLILLFLFLSSFEGHHLVKWF